MPMGVLDASTDKKLVWEDKTVPQPASGSFIDSVRIMVPYLLHVEPITVHLSTAGNFLPVTKLSHHS